MKQIILFVMALLFASPTLANDIYITQSGDTLDLDIVQDGQDNEFGDSTTDATLDGDAMTFNITQTGDYNQIDAIIKGNTYTGTWTFTGDDNTVDLTCDSTSGVNCEDVTLIKHTKTGVVLGTFYGKPSKEFIMTICNKMGYLDQNNVDKIAESMLKFKNN